MLAKAVSQHGKSNESRASAPLEHACLDRQPASAKKGDEVLTEGTSAAIEMALVLNSDAAKRCLPPWLEATKQWFDMLVLDSFPSRHVRHYPLLLGDMRHQEMRFYSAALRKSGTASCRTR